MKRILVDYHHTSLLTSLKMLFGDRLRYMLYRPIGIEWFDEGFWAINNARETAEQFLSLDQQYKPGDGTPPLNTFVPDITLQRDKVLGETPENGVYYCGFGSEINRACTLDFFKKNKFDLVLCSIPQHIEPFKRLIKEYMPDAKLIFQVGNDWDFETLGGMNVLASVRPRRVPDNVNVMFYHQEFDTNIFRKRLLTPTKKINSYINILQNTGQGWQDFTQLEEILQRKGFEFKSYGGQCRDGNIGGGPADMAESIKESMFVFHVKPGGDGFGHVIHNAYAMGRPVITRRSHYEGKLAAELLIPGTCIDLDECSIADAANRLVRLSHSPLQLAKMGKAAHDRFKQIVNYDLEGERIKSWLTNLV